MFLYLLITCVCTLYVYSYYILCIYIHIDIAICFIHNVILLNLSITYSYKIICIDEWYIDRYILNTLLLCVHRYVHNSRHYGI